jgi:hypothetical protein
MRYFKSAEADYPHYGQRSYHIELRQVDSTLWHQRHVFTNTVGEIDTQEWIASFPHKPGEGGYIEVASLL